MKKILLLVLLVSLFAFAFSNGDGEWQEGEVNVNVEILKHVEIFVQTPPLIDNWNRSTEHTPSVQALDPSFRDYGYITQTGATVGIRSNASMIVKTFFRINTTYMPSEFYNYVPGSTSGDFGNIEGGLLVFRSTDVDFDGTTDPLELYDYPISITPDSDPQNYTVLNKLHDDGEIYVQYCFQIKFEDENWWMLQAGEDKNLGHIIILVEATDLF
ncbi:MAG: hypothetical protein ACQESN_09890 [Thermotogota bacterium]